MATSAGQISPLERDRLSRFQQSRGTPLPELSGQRTSSASADDGLLFGEEGFGDVENRQTPGSRTEAEEGNDEAAVADEFSQRTDALRQQAAQTTPDEEEEGEENEEENENELTGEEQLRRDLADSLIGKVCLIVPVLGHLVWWNIKMVYGSWIKKGKDKNIGPFTLNDVLLIVAPKAPPGSGTKIIPDEVMQCLLVIADLLAVAILLMTLVIISFPFIIIYFILTDPLKAASLFGSTLTDVFSSLIS